MDGWPINPFDTAVIVIILLSGALAFMRGFTREVLSMLAWVGAAAVTYVLFPNIRSIGQSFVSPGWLADGLSALGIFIPSLIILWILSSSLSKRVKSSSVGALDHTLGFIFGLGRGAVLVAILFLGLGWLVPMQPTPPEWIGNARTLPLVRHGADLFLTLQPGASRPLQLTPNSQVQMPTDSAPERGYKTLQRQSLEQLIEGSDASP